MTSTLCPRCPRCGRDTLRLMTYQWYGDTRGYLSCWPYDTGCGYRERVERQMALWEGEA